MYNLNGQEKSDLFYSALSGQNERNFVGIDNVVCAVTNDKTHSCDFVPREQTLVNHHSKAFFYRRNQGFRHVGAYRFVDKFNLCNSGVKLDVKFN